MAENQPVRTFRVAENQPAGTVVGDVTAVDRDAIPFNRVVYSLDPVSDQIFRVDADTGRLVTRRSLDREESASYHAVVVARPPDSVDDASVIGPAAGACDVDIVVDDVNDSRPRFQFPTASNDTIVVRASDAGIGHVIGQVRASDRDAGVNARLVYRLSTQAVATLGPPSTTTTTNAFRIDADSGQLTTVMDLRDAADGRHPTEFIVEVVVSDFGTPSLSNSAPLRVVVGTEVVELRRTDAHEDDGDAVGWDSGAVAQLLALSGDELLMIAAFILSAVFVSVCVVVVCAARYDRRRDKRSVDRQPEVVAIGDASIDSPLMMTSLTSDSMMTSDRQVRISCDVC